MSVKTRLLYLLVAWLTPCFIYIATGFVKGTIWLIPEIYIDGLIPFGPSGIWLYLLFYVYIPYTFITTHQSNIKPLTYSFVTSAVVSGLIFFILPSSMMYPDFEVSGVNAYFLNLVKIFDTPLNCFPSLHGSLITLCTIANWDKQRKLKSRGLILLTVLMYYSIIQVRRHLFIDLSAGIILALLVWPVCVFVLNKRGVK